MAQLKLSSSEVSAGIPDQSQGMSLLGREIVPVFVPGEQGCSHPRPKRQELRARSPVVSPGHHV